MTQKLNPQDPGNTTAGSFRARAFQLTLHDLTAYETIKEYLTESKVFRYLISCMEVCPTTDKKHIHIYVNYTESKMLSVKKCGTAHIEKCKGSPKQNIEYIKKDGNIIDEIGDIPHQGSAATVKELKETKSPDELNWRMYNTWSKIQNDINNEEIDIDDWNKSVKVYYISGPSGVGKTEKAKTIVRENKDKYGTKISRVKYDGKFWAGARSKAKIAIYDDFRDSHMHASEFINFIDYNRHNMNIKGGSCSNDYELIIITSVIPLKNIYSNMSDEPRHQWERRIENIIMDDSFSLSDPTP